MARFLTEENVRQLLPMAEALAQVEACFQALGTGQARNQPRRRIRMPGGMMHVMSAGDRGLGVFGHKVYTTTRRGARFLITLYSTADGRPLAVLEAGLLGAIRTGAASGIATKYLANPDAAVLGVLGTGRQSPTQIQAVCAVRPIARGARVQPQRGAARGICGGDDGLAGHCGDGGGQRASGGGVRRRGGGHHE